MESYKEFWELFAKGYGRLAFALFLSAVTVAASLLEAVNIGLLLPLLENIGGTDTDGGHWVTRLVGNLFETLGIPFGLGSILLALGVFMLAMASLKYLRMILVGKISESFTAWLRADLMWKFMQTDLSYFHRQRVGVLTDTMTTQANRAGDSLYAFFDIVTNFGMIVAYLLAAFLIAPMLALVALGMMAVITLIMQNFISKARTLSEFRVTRENEYVATTMEDLSGIHVIKTFLMERFRWADFKRKAEDVRDFSYDIHKNRSQVMAIQEVALFSVVGAIVFVGVSVLSLDIAVIVTLLFVLFRLTPRITGFNNGRQSFAVSLATLHNVKEIMDDISTPTIVSGNSPFAGLKQGIELKGLHFSYDGGSQVLQDTTFTIPKGQMTAIVGTSGSGKSTLIELLLRYYDPTQGQVLVDGVNLKTLDLTSWRHSIGLVTQEIFLFNDTVLNNILVGRMRHEPDSVPDGVIEAAKQAYAHDFICRLPQGYETKIGDRGWNLSGGERQRIALSRAIVMKPEILILDEATSALDSESERLIQNYIDGIRGSRTLVVVAHRMSTIQSADNIVVLQAGKIIEQGTWDSLVAHSGVFANYQQLQAHDV